MTIGHVALGDVGAQRQYMLQLGGYNRSLANQMAPQVGQGGSIYANLDSYSAWIQEDWQSGIGRTRPLEDSGYLYGDIDSRVPRQLILPPLIHQSDRRDLDATIEDCRFMPEDIAGVLGAGTYAMKFTTPASFVGTSFYLYRFYANVGTTTITASTYTNVADAPGTLVAGTSGNFNETGNAGGQWAWYSGTDLLSALSTATSYWLVIVVPSGAQVAYGSSGYARTAMQNTGSWVNLSSTYILHSIDFFGLDHGSNTVEYPGTIFRLGSTLYLTHRNDIYKYVTANDNWTSVGTAGSGNITCAIVFDDKVYLGKESGDFYTMTVTTETIAASAGGEDAKLFAVWDFYLYRAFENDLYYTADGTTWEGPIEVPSDAYQIRGLAAMGDYMHMATDEGLYYLAPGDIVKGVTRWGTIDSENGRNMVHHNGNLYIPVDNRILEYSASGSIRDIWTTPENLPVRRGGAILSLYSSNTWLLAMAGNDGDPAMPVIWAWQEEGWHAWVTPPEMHSPAFLQFERTPQVMYLDRTLNRLWFIDGRGVTWWITTTDFALNPINDDSYKFMPFGWIEWDWFDGTIRENSKDFESVTITGENFSAARYGKLYWQDDASTDWELLGTVDSNSEELRWVTGGGTRPNTKRFKLGMLLATSDADETPRIQAIRVKYMTMVQDWFAWTLPILLSGTSVQYKELLDNTMSPYTGSQELTHLTTLAKQVAPYIFTDLDGTQYEVKTKGDSLRVEKLQYINSTKVVDYVYTLTIEQITQATYSA